VKHHATTLLLALLCASTARAGAGRLNEPNPTAEPPNSSPWALAWSVAVPGAGRATPAVDPTQVYVQVEPTTLLCLDRLTGAERWRHDHSVLAGLPPAERAGPAATLAAATSASQRLPAALRLYGELTRKVRQGTASAAELDALAARIAADEALVAAARPLLTPPGEDEVGWAAPSPLLVPGGVVVSYGNGLVAHHRSDGAPVWQRWLGPMSRDKHAYTGADAASPIALDGVLIVPATTLTGLDLRTGAVRWTAATYRDYGTPAPLRAGSRSALALSDGRVLDATTGAVLRADLPRVVYASPASQGADLWIAGAAVDNGPLRASHWSFGPDGGLTERWTIDLDSHDRLYATPLVAHGRLYLLTRHRRLIVLDAASGARLHEGPVEGLWGEVIASPLRVGDALYVTTRTGQLAVLSASPPFTTRAVHQVPASMATPWVGRREVVVVGADKVARFADPR
jgi:outer membrane protein assembly factor BamB